MKPRIIKTHRDDEEALARIDSLMGTAPYPASDDADELGTA